MATYSTMKSDQTITVQDFIAMKNSDEITYYNFSIVEYLNGYDMFITNILYDYEDELKDLCVYIKLSDVERLKYRYKPYLFAYDLYGSREMAFIIMMLNGIIDPKEFDYNKLKVIKYSSLTTVINRIGAINENFMNKNKAKLKKDFKNNEGNNIWIE